MKTVRKHRPSYILVIASAAQLSLTGCHSDSILPPKPSCQEKYDHSYCPTVNPAPIFDHLEQSKDDFDSLAMKGLRPNPLAEEQYVTIEKDALSARQQEMLKNLYEISDLSKLSCAPDSDGVAYKMMLYKKQIELHTYISSNGYCDEFKSLKDVTFVELTALKDFYSLMIETKRGVK